MIGLVIAVGVCLVIFLPLLVRPLYIHRGLTSTEWRAEWPGDVAVEGALPSGSRAILIEAPATIVWPWLTQIGQDRGGFYSYRWLENLVGAQMPDVRQIRPEWSHRIPGEPLIMAPVSRFGPIAAMELVEAVENSHLIYRNREGAWSFILKPEGEIRCRLVFRGTWVPAKSAFTRMLRALIFDPIHFHMEWKMARSIKHLAEADFRRLPQRDR